MNSDTIPLRPHRVVLFVKAEVHPLNEHGECAGTEVHKADEIIAFDGEDRAIAIRRLEDLIEELKGRFTI